MAENNNQANVRQYLENVRQELYDQRKTIRKRFLDLHNRMPSKEEEALYLKRKLGGEDSRLQEQPLQESHPEDYLPIGTALKLGATGVAGGAALLSMMLRKGPTTAKGVAKSQGGWIGSAMSKMTPEQKAQKTVAGLMFNKGAKPEDIYKKTGWFQFSPGEYRYLDLDFVDEMASGPLKAKNMFTGIDTVTPGPVLSRHAGGRRIQVFERDLGETAVGQANTNARVITKNTKYPDQTRFEREEVLGHEVQHVIQNQQKLPGGSSIKGVQEEYNSPSSLFVSRVYQHKLGEVEARTTQAYRQLARDMLDKGMPVEKVKAAMRKIQPEQALHTYENKVGMVPTDMDKIWTNSTSMKNKWPQPKPSNEGVNSLFGL